MDSNEKCRNCGGDYGIHHCQTLRCPVNGRESPVGRTQEYSTSIFETAIPYDELKEQRDALLEACIEALLINYTVDENGEDELELSPRDAKCKQMMIAAIVRTEKEVGKR